MREWGRGAEAFPHFMHAADFYAERGVPEERVFTAAERSLLLVEFGDAVMAEQLARTAVDRCAPFSNPAVEMTAHRALGVVLRETGRGGEARAHLEKAVELAEKAGQVILQADAHEELALLEAGEGHLSVAEFHRDATFGCFARMGLTKHRDRFDRRFIDALRSTQTSV